MNKDIEKLLRDRYFFQTENSWEDICDRLKILYPPMYNYLKDMKFMYSSPTLMNYCNNNERAGTLSSCFPMYLEDSIEGIFDAIKEAALVTKAGGGVGYDFSVLRGSNENIKTLDANSSGPVTFIEGVNNVLDMCVQGGKRRGAGAALLDITHPDIIEFINVKKDKNKLNRVNLSVKIPNVFYEKLKKSPDASHVVCKIVNKEEYELKDFRGSVVTVKQLWDMLIDRAWESAEPGIFNSDIAFNQCTVTNVDKHVLINPCLRDTVYLLTPIGIKQLKDISIGDEIWSKEGWTKVINKFFTGIKEVFEYHTTSGVFESTDNHEIVSEGIKVAVKDVENIDVLVGPYERCRKVTGREIIIPELVMDGLVLGDGCYHKASNNKVFLCIGEKDSDYFSSEIKELILKDRRAGFKGWEIKTNITYKELPRTYERCIPKRYMELDSTSKLSFLRGLYSANGSICGGRITYKTASFNMVKDLQLMLSSIGIHSYYTTNKAHNVEFRNGIYECKISFDVNITSDAVNFYESIGFVQKYKMNKLKEVIDNKKRNNTAKNNYDIIATESIGVHDVWDITVDNESHTFWCNGFNISNCFEFVNIPYTACSLGSINLSKLVEGKKFDWERFEDIIVHAVRALNTTIDKNKFPLKKIKEMTLKTRPIGLGYMGLAHALFKKEMPYNSERAIKFVEEMTRYLTLRAMKESVELAKEYQTKIIENNITVKIVNKDDSLIRQGAYEAFDYDLFMKANERFFKYKHCRNIDIEQLQKDIKKYGIRNSAFTAVAPTGCLEENTRIKTSKGLVKIKDLVDIKPKVSEFDFSIIKNKIKVYDEYRSNKVVSYYNNGFKEGYVIKLTDGRVQKISSKHRLRVLSNAGDYTWEYATKLRKGDVIVSKLEEFYFNKEYQSLSHAKKSDHFNCSNAKLPNILDEDVAEFAGFFTGDGSLKFRSNTGKCDAIRFPIYGKDTDLIKYFNNKFYTLFGTECLIKKHPNKNMYEVSSHSINMCNWFISNGFSKKEEISSVKECKKHTYHIPELIFRSPQSVVCAYLRGLFEADGSVCHTKHNKCTIALSSKFEHLLLEVQELLWNLGIQSTLRTVHKKSGYNKIMYYLTISNVAGKNIFATKINFISIRKKNILQNFLKELTLNYDKLFISRGHLLALRNAIRIKYGCKHKTYSNVNTLLQNNKQRKVCIISRNLLNSLKECNIDLHAYFPFDSAQYITTQIQNIHKESFQMYDIEVSSDAHTYITANGLINHNTISFISECSSGIEPVFALAYHRRIEVGNKEYETVYVTDPIFEEHLNNNYTEEIRNRILKEVSENSGSCQNCKDMPKAIREVFVVANDLTPMEHLDILEVGCKNISMSVSKTINVPEDIKKEDLSAVFLAAYEKGIVGLTVYRKGSREGILLAGNTKVADAIIERDAPKRPKSLPCHVYKITVKGDQWIVFVGLFKEHPYEVFAGKVDLVDIPSTITEGILTKVKSGTYVFEHNGEILIKDIAKIFESAEQEALTRMISTNLRHGTPVEFIIDQLSKSYGTIVDFNKAILRALKSYMKEKKLNKQCPSCGQTLMYKEGCIACIHCGWSKCA